MKQSFMAIESFVAAMAIRKSPVNPGTAEAGGGSPDSPRSPEGKRPDSSRQKSSDETPDMPRGR